MTQSPKTRFLKESISSIGAFIHGSFDLFHWRVWVGLLLVAFSIGANLISSYYAQSHRPNDDTQATIDKTIRALQDNAGQAMQLIEDLQNQITARTKAIQEAESRISDLNKQRAVLQLSGVLVAGYRQRHITKRNPINSGAA